MTFLEIIVNDLKVVKSVQTCDFTYGKASSEFSIPSHAVGGRGLGKEN